MSESETKSQLVLIDSLPETLTSKELTSDEYAVAYEALDTLINKLKQIKDKLDKESKDIVKDNYAATGETKLVNGKYRYIYVTGGNRETVDAKQLKADLPDVYKKYVKVNTMSDSVRIVKIGTTKSIDTKPDIIEG